MSVFLYDANNSHYKKSPLYFQSLFVGHVCFQDRRNGQTLVTAVSRDMPFEPSFFGLLSLFKIDPKGRKVCAVAIAELGKHCLLR